MKCKMCLTRKPFWLCPLKPSHNFSFSVVLFQHLLCHPGLCATVANYLEVDFSKPVLRSCFTSVDQFWDAVVANHPSSDEELCSDRCIAFTCSAPETKLQNSWQWKLNLLQHLHRQKRIHLTHRRSSFFWAVFSLNIWRPVVVMLCPLKD